MGRSENTTSESAEQPQTGDAGVSVWDDVVAILLDGYDAAPAQPKPARKFPARAEKVA